MVNKYSKLLPVFILLSFFAAQTSAQSGHNIKITVHGLPQDSLCFLANYFGDKQYLQDSAKADSKGTIIFKGKDKKPGGIYLFVLPGKSYFEFVMDKEQNFSMETSTADFVSNMKITGSNENILFYEYLRSVSAKSKEMEQLRNEYEAAKENKEQREQVQKKLEALNRVVIELKTKFMSGNPDAFMTKVFRASQDVDMPPPPKKPDGTIDSLAQYLYYRDHFFDKIDMTDDRLLRTPIMHNKIEQYIKKLTPQIPDSINAAADRLVALVRTNPEVFKYVVWWVTNQYETSNLMGMDGVFVHMAEKYYTRDQAIWADSLTIYKIQERAKTLKPILVGKKVKNLILQDTTGNYVSLYSIRKPHTVLFFWDPDCGHCQKTVPVLKELYDSVKTKGVEVFAVDTEVELDKWRKYIRDNDLDWINVSDPDLHNNFRHEFDLTTTPQIFLLDQNKTIVAKRIDVPTLGTVLQRIFEEEKKQ